MPSTLFSLAGVRLLRPVNLKFSLFSLQAWLERVIPNVMSKPDELWEALVDTLRMVLYSGVISIVLGLVLGVILHCTRKGDVLENRVVHWIADKSINVFRSIPFIILITLLLPLTRAVAGTAIGVRGAILPLVFGTVPYFSRQVEMALAEVDPGLIEAALAMGCSPMEIVLQVYLREAVPGLIRGTTLTLVSLIGLTAMSGAVGAGGLGDFAIRYGHANRQFDVTLVVVLIILAMVSLIQGVGKHLAEHYQHEGH